MNEFNVPKKLNIESNLGTKENFYNILLNL
jgi:hypothetical protein